MAPGTDRTQYREVLASLVQKTQTRFPDLNGRLTKATKLALMEDVELHDDGSATVHSASDPTRHYRIVEGTCTCRDWEHAPEHLCQHRLAAGLVRKAHALMPPDPALAPLPEAPCSIDPRHIVSIQGKPFVRFAGLLTLAHQRGLQSLKVEWTFNDAELSLAHAVAVFPFGTFEESGDATRDNVNKKVAPHFRRCALTRAAARVLRDALNCDMVALEELGGSDDV
jgi:hypothetical protein